MCAVDLNADGLSDLLVGAPMAMGVAREEGRVHVYINQGQVCAHHTQENTLSVQHKVRDIQTGLRASQLRMCGSYHFMNV